MTAAAWVQVAAMIFLVGVTYWYARSTSKMADEMRRVREAQVRPIIVMGRREVWWDALQTIHIGLAQERIINPAERLHVWNPGYGPALNIEFSLEISGRPSSPHTISRLGILGIDDKLELPHGDIPVETLPAGISYLVARYNDILDRPKRYTTRLEIDYNAEGKTMTLGQLTFTVEGTRGKKSSA